MSQLIPSSARSRSRSALRPAGYTMTSTEPAGANRDSPEPSPNTTRRSEEPEDKFTKACRQKGRWINASICFGVDLQDIFRLGIRSDLEDMGADDDDDDDTYRNMSAEEKGLLLTAYRAILKLIPKLKSILTYHADADAEYFSDVVNAMQEGCNAARSEAIKRIKDNTIRYLTAGRTPIKVDALVEHKALRGLNDRNIGRLLIPAEELHEWDADPDATRAAFLSGDFMIWGVDLPVFLYEDYTYNQEDPEEGLFRGAFLVCVLIDIFFGANAVDVKNLRRDDQPRHHCIGEMYGLTSISPENIAYAAVVARFCLSSKRMWSIKDELFSYRTFYQTIVLTLADREDPWVQDTLAWWNDRVFGNDRGKIAVEDADNHERVRWDKFHRRQRVRKALSRTVEARTQVLATRGIPSTPSRDASRGDADPMYGSTPHGSPSTPTSRPNPVIDPRLLETPDLDRSTMTQPSPPDPQTPGAPGPSSQRALSPLSDVSDHDADATTERTEAIRGLPAKRKKMASTAGRPRTRAKRKTARA